MNVKRLLAIGVILLFLGMTISSSTGLYLEKQNLKPMSFGNILYVGGNGTGNYTSIQDAIDDASDGDTVFVYDDSSPYYENLEVEKSINLIGENKDTTTIDGEGNSTIINVSANYVNISGFTIQDCEEWRYGVSFFSNYNTISENNFISTEISLYFMNSLSNTIFKNNFNSCKYGIFLESSQSNTIDTNTFFDCSWAGVMLFKSFNNYVTGNTLDKCDSGVLMIGSYKNKAVYNFITKSGYGVYILNSNKNTISKNIIQNCYGGIITEFFPAPEFTNKLTYINIIYKNEINDNEKFGICSGINSILTTIIRNNIINNGRGVYMEFSFLNKVRKNNFIGNDLNAILEFSLGNSWRRNYWDDWDNKIPYRIEGTNDMVNYDWFPRLLPYILPIKAGV